MRWSCATRHIDQQPARQASAGDMSACDDRRRTSNKAAMRRNTVVAADSPNYARKLGIQKNQIVQELGWDEDTDDDIRADVEEACGGELLDEDADEVDGRRVVVVARRRRRPRRPADGRDHPAGRGRRHLGGHAQDGTARPCAAGGDRRIGTDGRTDADVLGEPRRLDRQSGSCSPSRRPRGGTDSACAKKRPH